MPGRSFVEALLRGIVFARMLLLHPSILRPRVMQKTVLHARFNCGRGAILPVAVGVGIVVLLHVSLALAGLDEGLRAYQSGNYTAAVQELLQSAKHGDARAQANLGAMYALGKGVGEDSGEAVKWLTRSARQGYWRAQNVLGWLYFGGTGVPRDLVRAYAWFALSAENATGEDRDTQERARDSVLPLLTPEELAAAQAQVTELGKSTTSKAERSP